LPSDDRVYSHYNGGFLDSQDLEIQAVLLLLKFHRGSYLFLVQC